MTTLPSRIRTATPDQYPALNREMAIALGWQSVKWFDGQETWKLPDNTNYAAIYPNFLQSVDACITECERKGWVAHAGLGKDCYVRLHAKNLEYKTYRDDTNAALAFAEAIGLALESNG